MDRFGRETPSWVRRTLMGAFIGIYVLTLIVGLIGITWPSQSLETWQWIAARIFGAGAVVSGLGCLASYPARRWKWEMLFSLGSGLSMAGYVLVISTVGGFSTRALLLSMATIVVLCMFVRYFDLVGRALRWTNSREAVEKFDEMLGE